MNPLLTAGILQNNRFLSKTNPTMAAAVADGGSVLDREYIQRAARGIVDAGHLDNLKFWGVAGLAKLRNSGGVDYVPKLYDLSGEGNDGVQTTEANQPVWGATGLTFDGSDDVMLTDYNYSDYGYSQPLTLSCWAKISASMIDTAANTNMIFLGVGANNPDYYSWPGSIGLAVYRVSGYLNIYIRTETVNMGAGKVFTVGDWMHITGTWDGANTLKFYLDGALEATNSTVNVAVGETPKNKPFKIGGDDHTFGSITYIKFFDGIVNDIRIYNTALTGTEIAAIYNLTKGRYGL